jgi:hypothetical protein
MLAKLLVIGVPRAVLATLNVQCCGVEEQISLARRRIYVDMKYVRPRNPNIPWAALEDRLPSFLGLEKWDERLLEYDEKGVSTSYQASSTNQAQSEIDLEFAVSANHPGSADDEDEESFSSLQGPQVDQEIMLEVQKTNSVEFYEHHRHHPKLTSSSFESFKSELHRRYCSSTYGPKCYDGKFYGGEDEIFSVVPDSVIKNATNPKYMRNDPYEDIGLRNNTSLFNAPMYGNEHDFSSIAQLQKSIYMKDEHNGLLPTKALADFNEVVPQMGLITLKEAQVDNKVAKSYSGELFEQSVSVPTWEGKWVVGQSLQHRDRKVAALTSGSGYLRFSHPVLIRSLMVEIDPTKRVSLVGGRRGSETVWLRALSGSSGKVVTVDLADEYSMGLQAVDEIFFVASGLSQMKLVSVEVVAAAQSERKLVFLSRDGELAIDSIDEAGTKYLVSLEDVIKSGFELIPRNNTADVTDEHLVKSINKMIHNPGSVFEDVKQIVAADNIPKKLLGQIKKHGAQIGKLMVDVHQRLPSDRKTKRKLTRYNDLLLAAWLHWIQ